MRCLILALGIVLLFGQTCNGDGSAAIEQAIVQLRTGKTLNESEIGTLQQSVTAAIAATPENDRARFAKALLDRARGDRKVAKSEVEQLVKAYPTVAEYQASYGTLCFETINDAGTFEKMSLASTGRAAYEKAIELDPSLLEPRVGLGRFFLMAPGYAGGSYKKAEEQATALIAIPDGKGEMLGRVLLADIYADKGEWEKMTEQYRLAESAPGAGPSAALRSCAQALLNKKKDPRAAIVVLERYQRVAAPDDAAPWYLMGEARRALGEEPRAIECYARAVEINPAAVNSRFALAELLEKNKRFSEASVQYEEFARRFPSDARASKAAESSKRCLSAAK